MNLNPPLKLRQTLYVITVLGNPIIAVLADNNVIPEWVRTLWNLESAAVAGLALFNTINNSNK